MRKIAAFLTTCILICSINFEVFANENNFITVSVITGDENKTWYSVIKTEDDLLFSGEDLAGLSGFDYEIHGEKAIFTRGDKEIEIVIKDNSYRIGENLSVFTFENSIVSVNGNYYFSGAELLPWLNVDCIEENGKLYITRDPLSLWEVGSYFNEEKEDMIFDFEKCCMELGVSSKWLKAGAYVRSEGIEGMFSDIIWVPFSSHSLGEQLDYIEIFEQMLQDGTRVQNAFEMLFENSEVINAGFSVIEELEGQEELPNELLILQESSDIFSKFENYVEYATYLKLVKQSDTEYFMWINALNRNRTNYNYPDAMISAALEVEGMYKETYDARIQKLVYTCTDDLIEKFVELAMGEGITGAAIAVFDLFSATKPSWSEGINNVNRYNSIAQCGIEVYEKEKGSTHIDSIKLQRAHSMFYLYGIEQNWRTMADYANDKGKTELAKKYNESADKALEWQGKFLTSAEATVNDSHEYGEGYCKEEYEAKLRVMFEKLNCIEENDLEEYQLTEKEALEIATELISKCETYQNMGVVCELESYDCLSSEERDAIWEMVPEDVKGAYGGEPMKSMCCKTYEDVKNHVYECIDSSLVSSVSDAYVSYNDDLFFFMGNKGSITYKDVTLTKFDECEINAIANLYNSGDILCDTYCFVIKKTDAGNYKVSDIKLVGNTTDDTTENDITPIQTDWAQLYKQLLLGFSESKYVEYYTDQTIPVLFDIDNDETPELFVFCGIGANLLIEKCIMFQIRNNKIEAYYCDNLYYGSGSCDNMKLYKDKNGEIFLLLSTFEVENKEGLGEYGNSLVKVSFDGERIVSEEIASNLGSIFMGDDDVFSFKNEIFNDFDSYYFAVSGYISSLDEMNTKNSSKNERSNVFPIGLYGISVDDIDKIFHAYMNS